MKSLLRAVPSGKALGAFRLLSETLTCPERADGARHRELYPDRAIIPNGANEGVHGLIWAVVASRAYGTILNPSSAEQASIVTSWAEIHGA